MVTEGKLCCKEFDLDAWMQMLVILVQGFLATDYMSFLQSPGTQGQNMRPNKVSKTYRSRV